MNSEKGLHEEEQLDTEYNIVIYWVLLKIKDWFFLNEQGMK